MTILYMNFSENKKKTQKDVRLLQDTHTRLRLEQHIASHSSRSRKWKTANTLFVTIPVSAQRISFLC